MITQELPLVALQAAISQSVTRVLAEHYGKGPARTRTYLFDDYVVAVCEDALTVAERALRDAGEDALIAEVREGFEDLMTQAFVAEVERLTGRTVVGYHSQVLVEHGSLVELFVLDPTQPGLAAAAAEADGALPPPGKPGDADALPAPGDRPAPDPRRDAPRPRAPHGRLRAEIADALVRVAHELHGRGPARARVHLADEHLVCALEEPLTTVERTLAAGGRTDLVRALRQGLLAAARDAYVGEVQRLTGRQVRSSAAQVVFDPDVVFLVFVLDGAPADELAQLDGHAGR
ncbi:MAG TPA: Na-translocating system protein MpsC family protein [Baekduia sp.]|nr:Na-translocating system protein MpsC family protein [Baekduia sp.]